MLRNRFPIPVRENMLLDTINRELRRGETYISDADVREILEELEDYFQGIAFRGVNGVIRKLKERLAKDKDSDRRQGLYGSRSLFIVSCFAAQHRHSIELAQELLRFLKRNADDIENEEKSILLREWCQGLSQLRGLVDGDDLDRVVRDLGERGVSMIEEWQSLEDVAYRDRERSRHRLERYGFDVRGLSVPARTPTIVDFSLVPRTTYRSPLRSLLYDEVDALHEQQHRLMLCIANLQRHVDRLGHRY